MAYAFGLDFEKGLISKCVLMYINKLTPLFLLQFLALGTHYGKVYLLDIQGNITQKFDVVSIQYQIMYELDFVLKIYALRY